MAEADLVQIRNPTDGRYALIDREIGKIIAINDAPVPGVPDNLISLCIRCHNKAHSGQIGKESLREIVRRREYG